MKDWYKRLLDEEAELFIKIEKLAHFRKTAKLPDEDLDLLRNQCIVMNDYIRILRTRINRGKD